MAVVAPMPSASVSSATGQSPARREAGATRTGRPAEARRDTGCVACPDPSAVRACGSRGGRDRRRRTPAARRARAAVSATGRALRSGASRISRWNATSPSTSSRRTNSHERRRGQDAGGDSIRTTALRAAGHQPFRHPARGEQDLRDALQRTPPIAPSGPAAGGGPRASADRTWPCDRAPTCPSRPRSSRGCSIR